MVNIWLMYGYHIIWLMIVNIYIYVCIYIYIYIGGIPTYPSETYDLVSWDYEIPK